MADRYSDDRKTLRLTRREASAGGDEEESGEGTGGWPDLENKGDLYPEPLPPNVKIVFNRSRMQYAATLTNVDGGVQRRTARAVVRVSRGEVLEVLDVNESRRNCLERLLVPNWVLPAIANSPAGKGAAWARVCRQEGWLRRSRGALRRTRWSWC